MITCREMAEQSRNEIIEKTTIHKGKVKYGVFYDRETGADHVVVIVDTSGTLFCEGDRDWILMDTKPGGWKRERPPI